MYQQQTQHGHVYLEVIDISFDSNRQVSQRAHYHIADSVKQLLGTQYPVKHEPLHDDDQCQQGIRLLLELPNDGTNHTKVTKRLADFESRATKNPASALPFLAALYEYDTWLEDGILANDDKLILKGLAEYPRIVYDALVFEDMDRAETPRIEKVVAHYAVILTLHINQAFLECYGWMPISASYANLDQFDWRPPFALAFQKPPCISQAENDLIADFLISGLVAFRMVAADFKEGTMDQINIEVEDDRLADIVSLIQKAKSHFGR